MKYPRHKGEFVGVNGDVWKVEIWQENAAAFPIIGDLRFDADCPVEIEWGEKAKEEVICGSTATIKVISQTDRAYEDLYTVEPGRVRADIYRNETLYWSGTIATEFYEEPYERNRNYTVSLTFGDFGILKRVKYSMRGMQSIAEILRTCLKKSDIKYIMLDTHMISTSLYADGRQMRLNDIKVRSENFYDEDGEASTLYDALEGIMQPLSMKLIQKNGKICVYDLNGMYWRAATRDIAWNSDSQTLSVDRVYNNVKITWSTYAQSGNMLAERAWGFVKTDANLTALDVLEGKKKDGATYYTYHCGSDAKYWLDDTDAGFTLWTSPEGMNAEPGEFAGSEFIHSRFFKTVPQNDGNDSEGIATVWPAYKREGTATDYWVSSVLYGEDKNIIAGGMSRCAKLFGMKDTWLPPVSPETAGGLILKLSMNMLMDVKFNPYEQAAIIVGRDEKTMCAHMEKQVNFVYVPVRMRFTENGTGKVWAWDNRDVITKDYRNAVTTMWGTTGRWVPYTETGGQPDQWGYLAYYDVNDRVEKCGVLGWKENRPAINPHNERLTSLLEKAGNGQFIPYPAMSRNGGKISIEILTGLWQMADANNTLTLATDRGDISVHTSEWDWLQWLMCELPKLEILNNGRYDKEINTDDVEYSSTLNDAAEEGLDIDTMCGTAKNGVPTARGAYFNAETNEQITTLTREHRTTQAEELLMGTLYSQYADRHTKLSGVAKLLCTDICAYTDRNQPGKKLICVSDVEDVRMNESDAVFIELSRDEYKNQEGV